MRGKSGNGRCESYPSGILQKTSGEGSPVERLASFVDEIKLFLRMLIDFILVADGNVAGIDQ